MHILVGEGSDEEIVLPASEIEGEMWQFDVWKALVDAVEDGIAPSTGHTVMGVVKLLMFLVDEEDTLTKKVFGEGGALKVIADLIADHETEEELRPASVV